MAVPDEIYLDSIYRLHSENGSITGKSLSKVSISEERLPTIQPDFLDSGL